MSIKACRVLAVAALVLAGAGACSRSQNGGAGQQGPAAVADRGGGDAEGSSASATGSGNGYRNSRYADAGRRGGGGYGGEEGQDRPPAPMFHGEPMWSENRSHTAQENAEYHFERAGADLGSHTLDDFLTKVHRFCDHPPAGTQSLSRANGDRLLYDPKSNLFAVVTKDGAPRTVFKPSDGEAYWTEQKARVADGEDGGGYRSRSYRRDEGGDYGRSGHYGRGDAAGGEDRSDR